jgi:glycosyltransferase involved in cell wall biosynthesis
MRAGAEVVQVSDHRRFSRRTPALLRRGFAARADIILVGFPGHADVAAARVLSRLKRAPVVFDGLTSLWEAAVSDRRVTGARTLAGMRYRLEDRLACWLADLVLVDTQAHASYFRQELKVPTAKLRAVPVGADDDVMRPQPARTADDVFRVFFYGSFIPLHGVEHIVEAARLLERARLPAQISIVGTGQTREAVERSADEGGLSNLSFLGRRPYEELPRLMGQSDICLGIFGTTPKAARVVPNKVFDALACRRAVVTRDSTAAREWLTHGENALLCAPGDPEALADAITTLREDATLRERVADGGYRLFASEFSTSALAIKVAEVVREVLRG